jgi:hypothetical protein
VTGVEVAYAPGDWLGVAGSARWLLVRPDIDVATCWRLVDAGADHDELLHALAGADLALAETEAGVLTTMVVRGAAWIELVDVAGATSVIGAGVHRADRPVATVRLCGEPGADRWLPLARGVVAAGRLSATFEAARLDQPARTPGENAPPDTHRFDGMFGATYHPVQEDEFAPMPRETAPAYPAPAAAPDRSARGGVLGLADIGWALATPAPPPVHPARIQPHAAPPPAAWPPADWPPVAQDPTLATCTPLGPATGQSSGLDDELLMTVVRDSRPNGSTVPAVRCTAGHLNPDTAPACRACGAPVPPQTPTTVPRPVLGRLLLPDGDVIVLDRGVILGRAPGVPDPADPDRPHHVKLRSPSGDISRKHVEIRLDGWQVLAVDLGSRNGTLLVHPDGRVRPLVPGDAVALEPGAAVHLNDTVAIRFEVTP